MTKTKTDAAVPAVIPNQSAAALAAVRDYYPNLSDEQKGGLRLWSSFQELCDLPFIPKTAAAEEGDALLFTILNVGERSSQFVDTATGEVEEKDQHILLVRIDTECDLTMRNLKKTVHFNKGDKALIGYPKGVSLRDYSVKIIRHGLDAYGGQLPGFYLEELPTKNPLHNGPIVLRCIFSGSEIIGNEREALPA